MFYSSDKIYYEHLFEACQSHTSKLLSQQYLNVSVVFVRNMTGSKFAVQKNHSSNRFCDGTFVTTMTYHVHGTTNRYFS